MNGSVPVFKQTKLIPAPAQTPGERYSVSLETVVPETAAEWLATRLYSKQRGLRQHTIKHYAAEMAAGLFTPGSLLKFVVFDGEPLLVDGQHRLSAVVEAGIPHMFTVQYALVDTLEDVDEQYANTDIGIPRTAHDALNAYDTPRRIGIAGTDLSALSAAISCIETGFMKNSRPRVSRQQLRDEIESWAEEGRLYLDVIKGGDYDIRKALRRGAVYAIGLVTLRHARDRAVEFFSAVAQDDGLRRVEPEKVLHNFLVNTRVASSQGLGRLEVVSSAVTARVTAACWNASIEGREMKQRPKVLDSGSLIRIALTPYTGKR